MIIVTGASRGIGKYVAEELTKLMSTVGLWNKTQPEPSDVIYRQVDATDEEQITQFLKSHYDLKKLTLVHCAGVNGNAITHKMDAETWDNVQNVNLKSAFLFSKHLLPLMRNENFGRIIFCSSVAPIMGVPGTAAYSASKAGLWGLMKTIAKEGATKNITCNCLNLGYIDAGMTHTEVPKEHLESIIKTIPMQRLGDPSNVLAAIKFLMEADYVTGSCIDINGGLV